METQNTRPSIGSMIRSTVAELTAGFGAPEAADAVMAQIAEADLAHYLRECLVSRISSEVSRGRGSSAPERKSLSTKQSLIRDQYWPSFLDQMIALPSGYKRLGDASADDLLFIANMRRSQASDLMAKADQFESLAHLMESAGVERLQELDSTAGELLLTAA